MSVRAFDDGIERALRAAERAHRGQNRKGPDPAPYVLHPIHCALTLARLGHHEDVVVAAILHDVVEDCEGWTVARVEREFGPRAARIVAQLTEDKTKSWEERKRAQVEHVPHLDEDALAVKAADKIHNLRTLLSDLTDARDRTVVWAQFRGGRDRTLAMSRALVDELAPRVGDELAAELRDVMADLERLERLDPSR